jgi:hypothetical protein
MKDYENSTLNRLRKLRDESYSKGFSAGQLDAYRSAADIIRDAAEMDLDDLTVRDALDTIADAILSALAEGSR